MSLRSTLLSLTQPRPRLQPLRRLAPNVPPRRSPSSGSFATTILETTSARRDTATVWKHPPRARSTRSVRGLQDERGQNTPTPTWKRYSRRAGPRRRRTLRGPVETRAEGRREMEGGDAGCGTCTPRGCYIPVSRRSRAATPTHVPAAPSGCPGPDLRVRVSPARRSRRPCSAFVRRDRGRRTRRDRRVHAPTSLQNLEDILGGPRPCVVPRVLRTRSRRWIARRRAGRAARGAGGAVSPARPRATRTRGHLEGT